MRKISFLLLESLVVVIIISALTVYFLHKHNGMFSNFPQYTVKFNDVNGLEVGAPVRFSGVHVGHVTKQELKDKKIFLTFKITDENLKLPKGSTAGVEFTGLAGSRSLEIRPPEERYTGVEEIRVIEPVRANSLLEIQKSVTRSTLQLSNGILNFLRNNEGKVGSKLKETADRVKEKTEWLKEKEPDIKATTQTAAENAKELKELVSGTCQNIATVHKAVNDFATDEETREKIDKIKESTEKLNELISSGEAQQKLEEINQKAKKLNYDLKKFNEKIEKFKHREAGYINEFNESIKDATKKMQEIIDSSDKKLSSNKKEP